MILVTGASGQNGRAVVRELVARGAKVRAATRSAERAEKGAAETVAFDYGDRGSVKKALAGADSVFLMSPVPSLETALVEEAKGAGVKRIVKLSVWRADQERYTFARWHRGVEKRIEATGLPHTFLRPGGFMQNVVNYFAPTIRSQGAFFTPAGEARISHVDVGDIARVAAVVLTEEGHDGKAYDLSGPEALSYHDVARILSEEIGAPVRYVDPGPEAWRKTAVEMGTPEPYADALVDLNRFYEEGGMEDVSPAVEMITGEKPRPFRGFVKENVAAFR